MASFHTLPLEILDLIAMNLDLRDYFQFRMTCRQTWSLFGCGSLTPILESIKALHGEKLEEWYEDCQLGGCYHISQGHILSYAYRKSGPTLGPNILGQRGASLKYIPCGDLVERAARSNDYQRQLSWLIHHGASYQEVRGGINRLCCEFYDRGDLERFRWLFPNGASLGILAEAVSKVPSQPGPRTAYALKYHRDRLIKALRAEEIPRPSRKVPFARQARVQ
jgi:hypothetical protein